MTHRWTLGYRKLEASKRVRSENFQRKSSGFRYFLLAPIVIYLGLAALAYAFATVLSGIVEVIRTPH